MALRRAGKGYVLGGKADHPLNSWVGKPLMPDQPQSNGQTEGQITRLKLVNVGRAKLDLLEAQLIGAS